MRRLLVPIKPGIYLIILAALFCACKKSITNDAPGCRGYKPVSVTKVLTSTDRYLNLGTPTTDSAISGCPVDFELEFGFSNPAPQAIAAAKNDYTSIPLGGLTDKTILLVDNSGIFSNNWNISQTVRSGTNIQDYFLKVQDHGGSAHLYSVYNISTSLLANVKSADSSVYVHAFIGYYDSTD